MSTVRDDASWAVLVASQHATSSVDASPLPAADTEVQHLLERARSVASSPDTICTVIAEELTSEWSALARRVLPENQYSQRPGEAAQSAVARALKGISQRDSRASLVLIPADHCAAEENAWVVYAKNAIRLGVIRDHTVIVLHDKPENDPRTSRSYPGVCSSSVMIGSLPSLLSLCNGGSALSVINMGIDDDLAAYPITALAESVQLNVVHITSVNENAKLQRGEYGRPRPQIDLRA